MTQRRLLCYLLALFMLLGLLPLFAACAKDGEIYTGLFKKTVDLSDFTIVYGEVSNTNTVSASFKGQVSQFAKEIQKSTGVLLPVESDQITTADKKDPQIVIGETNQNESISLRRSIKGDGFAISVKRNRITIVGSNAIMTVYALDYFVDNYLGEATDDGTLRAHRKIRANNVETLLLASSEDTEYAWVYEEGLDTEPGNKWGEPGNNADYDYPYQAALSAIQQLTNITKLPDRLIRKKTEEAKKSDKEILIGCPNREETQACLAQIPGDGYGLFTQEERVIVTSWSDSGLSAVAKIFQDLLRDATVTDGSGRVEIRFPKGMSLVGSMTADWVTDFPKPEGISLYNTQDAGNNALQYLYKGAAPENYAAYYNKLLSSGYTVLTENEIEESLFSTLVNEEKGHVINLTYNAYKHGAGNYKYAPMLRVISTPIGSANLPDSSILTPTGYEKKIDASITAMYLEEGSVGMGYVIQLEDGRFIIFDGGSNPRGEDERLFDILCSLHTKATGKEPAADNPICIAAWFITHSHGDHTDAFFGFIRKYVRQGYAQLQYLMGNYPSSVTAYNAAGGDSTMTDLAQSLGEQYGGFEFVKIHTGQRYYFSNLEIEVLCTQEDHNPIRLDYFNDTSSTVAEGNAVENEKATVTSIWTGDTFIYGSRFMSAMYGSYLRSDMVQIAHHGNNGAESHFYSNIKPTVVWWPHLYSAYISYTSGWSNAWQYKVDYHLIHQLGTVKYVYVSDVKNTTLTLTANGPDYEGIRDAITNEQLYYNYGYAVKQNVDENEG